MTPRTKCWVFPPKRQVYSIGPRQQCEVKEHREEKTGKPFLILPPSVATLHALVETRHWFIRTSNLDLVEGGLMAVAALCRALDTGLLGIVPGTGPAKDVLLLLSLVHAA